jgi:DNA-binding CsgD family transcriptional regulator
MDANIGAVSGPALLERDSPLDAIVRALAAVRESSGSALFVAAAAGMGKTAVLETGKYEAATSGFRVASAVGSRMEMGVPFGLVGQAIVALGGSEVDDPAELQRLGGQPARLYRMFRWLARVAAEKPLLLALDDLHWADPDSLELIGFIARRLADCHILVLGCLRPEPDPAWKLALELVGSGHATIVPLEPLSAGASRELLEQRAPAGLDAEQRDRVVSACAGTPLLLEAAAASLSDGGSLPSSTNGGGFRWSLLLERFAGLGDDAFRFVRAASILGVRFEPRVAGTLAGLDQSAWEHAHRLLQSAALMTDLGDGWTGFIHPLFAQALLESQPPSERERAHARAFRLLAELGAPDALAAEHALAGKLHGDPLAIEVTARAGRAALAQGALDAARAHLGSAVELAGAAAQAELLLDYASALAGRARMREAEALCARVLSQTELDPGTRTKALLLLARGAILAGQPADAQRLYEQAVAAATRADPESEAIALVDAASNLYTLSPLAWSGSILARALEVLPADDPSRTSIEFLDALTRLEAADPSGEEPLARIIESWLSQADPGASNWIWSMSTNAINALKLLEDLSGATELFEREFARAVDAGAPLVMTAVAMVYADAVWRIGRAREAVELLQRATALSGQPVRLWSDLGLAVALSELGRDAEAAPHIEAIRALTARVSTEYYASHWLWLAVLDSRRLLSAGDARSASDAMLQAAEVARLTGWRHPLVVPWAGVGIEAHLAAGRIDLARDLIEELDELSRPLRCRWPRAIVALGRAQLAAAIGDFEHADLLFGRALAMFDEVPMPIFRAEALVAYGSHLRRTGRPRDAREPLGRALEICERAGADRVARLARTELAATGGRRRRRDGDSSELTAQERRVAELAAQGMTNAQIAAALGLAPKTIGHYLERTYTKLGIRSRRELIGRVGDRG